MPLLTTSLICLGLVLFALALMDSLVRRWPLSPAVICLAMGWLVAPWIDPVRASTLEDHAPLLAVYTELVVLVSLFAVGLRLGAPSSRTAGWRVALLMAGPGMLAMIAAGTVAGVAVLGLPWAAALLLAAILAPTDPVLASEVRIGSEADRDSVRFSLTAEGGLNDGTAFPVVMLALGLLGLHELGEGGAQWWWHDLAWPIAGGALVGVALGWLLGHAVKACVARGDPVARDELLYAGMVALAFGVARATHTSTFIVVFAVGCLLLWPLHRSPAHDGQDLSRRLLSFGSRCERLVEAVTVLAVGIALHHAQPSWRALGFGLLLVFVVRPLSVWAVVWPGAMVRHQRRLVAWFGIRGIGSLFYLAFAIEHGVEQPLAQELVAAVLVSVALSILLHGVSATPLMEAYRRRA